MYRCRSAWKLLELDTKYHLFNSNCHTVLDLAAAPGGFSQVALEKMQSNLLLLNSNLFIPPISIAFDQRPIEPMKGLINIQCDINDHHRVLSHTTRILQNLDKNNTKNLTKKRHVQLVLHDGVSVVKSQSTFSVTYGQNQMALGALRLACTLFFRYFTLNKGNDDNYNIKKDNKSKLSLIPVGFITKAMHSTHFNHLLEATKNYFQNVDVHKPSESKQESLETYIVARNFKLHQWLKEERYTNGVHAQLSASPLREDIIYGRQILWRCWGCGTTRLGITPCPICN